MSNKVLESAAFIFSFWIIIAVGVRTAPIPFTLKRGIPEIEVVINDSVKATFAIDTGADHVYIDKTFAERHGLLSGGKMPLRPVAGIKEKVEAFQIFLRKFSVGEFNQALTAAVVIDLPPMVKDTSSHLFDGVLGYSFLKDQRFLLNYIDSTIEFTFDDSALAETKSTQIPFVRNRHLIVVNTKINDSVDAKMILDTGSSHTLLSPVLAKILNVKDSSDVSKIKLGGRVTTANVEILVRDIGEITASVKNEKITGVLGTTFLLGRRLVIDYPNNQLIFFANR